MSVDVVTGAFSYTGRFVAQELMSRGRAVRTLSRSPAPPGSPVEARPLQFADVAALVDALRDAETLYNTYWIRFERGGSTFARAVANTKTLLAAAREAGVPVRAVWIDTPPELCAERNAAREGRARVPDIGIMATRGRLEPPSTEEGFDRVDVVRPSGMSTPGPTRTRPVR